MGNEVIGCPTCSAPLTQVGNFWICPQHGQVSMAEHIGAWVFVSHSHRDLEKVREIRNYLEGRGHNPLLFFLKCLDDDDARLPDLIRDEIRARNWFVLCDSPNARTSRYVNDENAIVQSLEEKSQETIDLERELEPQLYKLDRLLKRATVFLSYAPADREISARIGDALRKNDYRIWTEGNLEPGENWAAAIGTVIDEAVQHGFVLLLVSEASLQSQFCRRETLYALERAAASGRSNVVPVIISHFDQSLLPHELRTIQYFDLTAGSFDEGMLRLIRNLKTRGME